MIWEKIPTKDLPAAVIASANGSLLLITSFLAMLPVAAFVKDTRGRLLYINPAAAKLWKTTYMSALGKTLPELIGGQTAEFAQKMELEDRQALGHNSGCVYVYMDQRLHFFKLIFPVRDANHRRLLCGMVVATNG
jgi:PAS domain-containing protein